jgi:hypothetical protein
LSQLLEARAICCGAGVDTEEMTAHVVVDTDNAPSAFAEQLTCF